MVCDGVWLVLGGAGTAAAMSAAHCLEEQSTRLQRDLLMREAEIKTLRYQNQPRFPSVLL